MISAPLGYLDAAGQRAQTILPLTWFTLVVSILVCIIIGVLLWMAVRRAGVRGGAAETRARTVERGGTGIRWISIGLLISAVPLLATLVWTMVALAAVSGPPRHPALVLDVTGHQWWWEVRYDSPQPSESFETANEIHIPVGVPVLVRLHGGDVIHSFWVPKLSGKTDAIPGQTNLSWIEARHAGALPGPVQRVLRLPARPHGLRSRRRDAGRLRTVAGCSSFSRLRRPPPAAQRGLQVLVDRCGLCHQVRGTQAGAVIAPDLTHVMSRRTLAGGRLVNTPGNLVGWIQNAQQIKPGTLMPNQYLSGGQLSDVLAYLETLQ